MDTSSLSPAAGQTGDFECPACKGRHLAGTAFCPNLGTPINLDQATSVSVSEQAVPAPVPPPVPAATPVPAPISSTTAADSTATAPQPQVITTKAVDTDKAAGIKVITIPRVTTYHMPGMCVACGKPLNGSTAKRHASCQQTSGNLRTTLSLDFPLCTDCDAVEKIYTKTSNKALGIAAAIIGPLAVIFTVVGLSLASDVNSRNGVWGGAICGGFILWMIVFGILQAILNKKLPTETQQTHKVTNNSVGITGFTSTTVTFKFGNETFANMFSALNSLGPDLLTNMIQSLINNKPK